MKADVHDKHHVTFFENQQAQTLTVDKLSLEGIKALILGTPAKSKDKLPWIKLAVFGDKRTDKNCLRNNANVIQITGVEMDYDGKEKKKVTFDEGIDTAAKIGLRCVLYTTANYKEAAPRWRLLAPTSKPLPPEARKRLGEQINRIFGSIFASESLVLSQSYYFGYVGTGEGHRAEIVEGLYIDQLIDHGFQAHLAKMGDGEGLDGFHFPLLRATRIYAIKHGSNFDKEDLKVKLRQAIEAAPKKLDRNPADIPNYLSDKKLNDYIESAIEKFGMKLPTIAVRAGEIARAVNETEKALTAAQQPVLVRAGILVQPLWSKYPTADGHETQATALKPLTVHNLAYMINRHAACFVKWDERKKKDVIIDPPTKVLAGLLELGHWGFPRVTGTINAPTMRPDGTILTEAGYDTMTGLWHWPDKSLTLPEIPARPTKADASAALELLNELFVEVPFIDDLDRAVALAALLTAVVRGAFVLAPLFLFVAHDSGTGKSYLVDVIAHIVHGRWCPVISFQSEQKEEMEKRIGALLLEGVSIISLDNLTDNLEGQILCMMTERPLVKVRILGLSEQPECEWRGTLFATGNNVQLVGDMTRRGLICNLDAVVEQPETRKFKFDPIAAVLEDRGKYLAAALTISRAYKVAGKPVPCSPIGSYGGWSRFVREPLIWLGLEDPVKSMEQARREDPNRNAAQRLVAQWKEHLGTERAYKVSDIIQLVTETKQVKSGSLVTDYVPVRPEFLALLLERVGGARSNTLDSHKLGRWLRTVRGQVHSGYRIVVTIESKGWGHHWKLEKL
jgi:putative DNA primase/helicase